MKKIVGVIQPFDMRQELYVYEDNNKIDGLGARMCDFGESLLNLAEKHGIEEVNLAGPKKYTQHLIEKIQEAEMTKFSMHKLKFTII